ncbi:MAG: alanyl-tRNA editing protein [Lachnospiraceae bacterium]|nr:alanyl-tRNA editing protein [Lachnospiraceae bacterium]
MLDSSKIRTRKLYYEDAYKTEFTAKVVSANAGDIVLDRTAFFPEEGGQSADTGVLGGFRVADVKIRDGEIHHLLEDRNASFEVGTKISGKIDWQHRFSNMQQHSGEHIFSGLVHSTYGFDNVGFHLSDNEVTLDFNGVIGPDGIRDIERRANEIITRNIPSEIRFLSGEEAKTTEYRSKIDLDDEIRVVTYPGVDACACCAPHVALTGEIGCLKVVGLQNYKGGIRVSILCGMRAMEVFFHDRDILEKTANYLSNSTDEVYHLVVKARTELAETKAALAEAAKKLVQVRIDQIPAGDGNAIIFEESLDAGAMRSAVNSLVQKKNGFCGVFAGTDKDGYRYVIGKQGGDARVINNELREKFGARGGGKPEMVQGSVTASRADIEALFGK